MLTPPFAIAAAPAAPALFPQTPATLSPAGTPGKGSRRRRLWELEQKLHCPLIGVCFDVDHLRELLGKHFHCPREVSDFTLHTSAVGACDERSALAEVLQKNLDKRFQPCIRRFAAAKSRTALRELWRAAKESGSEIPGALWTCWTHPACDDDLQLEIYGDIHMIQHQVGSGARSELATLAGLRAGNRRLREQLDATRRDHEALRAERTRATQTLSRQVAELRVDLAAKAAALLARDQEIERLRQTLPELDERQLLARRLVDADARLAAASARNTALERELAELGRALRQAQEQCRQTAATDDAEARDGGGERVDSADLGGKCVLCVGGRTAAIDSCRQLIEVRGGRFLHHDGGVEESLHRIDAAVAAADLVICQAGCISHGAYWRVKEQCKRSGKPCLYIKTTGISGLSRLIDASAQEALAATR